MFSLWITLLAAVPPITVGPDSASKAPLIAAPIARVTVFEDRARVTRRASVAVPAGASVWRLPDIPSSADIGALRATVSGGAQLLRVEAAPVERDMMPLEPAKKLLEQIDAFEDAIRRVDVERELVSAKLKLFTDILPAPPVPEANRDGRPPGGMFADAWTKVTAALSAERSLMRARIAALDADRTVKVKQAGELRSELARLGVDGASEQAIETLIVLQSAAPTTATVDLEYFVPGARWRPAYALHFHADAGKAELAAFGMVTQSTGEDWEDVTLELSTAIPSLGIELPELQTWTLGEAKEWKPIVYPRAPPVLPPAYPMPEPRATALEEDRLIERALVMSRIQSAHAPEEKQGKADFAQPSTGLDFSAKLGSEARGRSSPGAPPPPPPPPPRASPPTLQMRSQPARDELRISSTPSSIATESDSEASPAYRALALYEAPPPPPFALDPLAPASLAGGLDHVYVVPTRSTIKSSGEAYRAPLGTETHPVTAFYEATPALAPEAYLRATVTNRSPRPILGGPVGIFLGKAFSGDGQLETTGAGGTLALPLGGDEDVRVSRKVIITSETKGVFSKDRVTTYRVVLEIASFKQKPIKVVVREPLPKTGREEIEIERTSKNPVPDADGILRWDVDVAPGKVQTIELVYRVKAPADWRLYQR